MTTVITQQGALNTNGLPVPGTYIQIVPPGTSLFTGVPTNIAGLVGTASWGPVNAPTIVGSYAQYAQQFGPIINRKYDMGTHIYAGYQQGGLMAVKCVRVTDGTDTAASVVVGSTAITYTSKYTGSFGNNCTITLGVGSSTTTATPTYKVTVAMPGVAPEIFDNIGGTGAALWANITSVINSGSTAIRGPSNLIVATAGTATTAPTVPSTVTLTGGVDGSVPGTGHILSATLIGVDATPRTGMYALRSQGVQQAALCDADDSTQWSTQVTFGLSEGVYMVGVTPLGDTISAAITAKQTAGIDSPWWCHLLGDWIYWQDPVNNVRRYISPQAVKVGLLSNLAPQNSTLNKQIQSIIGTGRSISGTTYSVAELTLLNQAGIDVVANPSNGGNYFGFQTGHNSSSDQSRRTDTYTRMVDFIGQSLPVYLGTIIGQNITPTQMANTKASLDAFFGNLVNQAQIAAAKVQLDANNNPQTRTALGIEQVDIQVQLFAVLEEFLVNLQAGASVFVAPTSATPSN